MSQLQKGVKPVLSGFGTLADFLSPTLSPYRVSLVQRQLRRDCREFEIGFSPRCNGDWDLRWSVGVDICSSAFALQIHVVILDPI